MPRWDEFGFCLYPKKVGGRTFAEVLGEDLEGVGHHSLRSVVHLLAGLVRVSESE